MNYPYPKPTVQEFKDFFFRDFPFQPEVIPPETPDYNKYIQDMDVVRAMLETDVTLIGPQCLNNEALYRQAFMYMTAHNLVTNIQASNQGLASQYDWSVTSKSVGSVSVGLSLPPYINDNPALAMLAKTAYGAKYISLIYHCLIGNICYVPGGTKP